MAYVPPLNGGRINATIAGNTAGAGALVSTGTMYLAGGNNITLSQNANSITISGGAGGVFSAGISNGVGNTSGATGLVGSQYVLAGGNNIVLSQSVNGGSATLTISASSQTNQTLGLNVTGNTTVSSASITRDARTLSFSGMGAVSVGLSGNAVQISAPTQTNQTLSFSAGSQSTLTAGGTFDARSMFINGVGNISAGFSNSSIFISGSQSVQTQNLHNVTLAGNSTSAGAGYAQISSGTLTLAGGNNITLSQNGNAVTIVGGAGGGGGGIALANAQTTYPSGTVNLIEGGGAITIASTTGQSFQVSVPATSSLSATGALSISTNGSTISIGVATPMLSRFVYPDDYTPLTPNQVVNNTVSFNYVSLNANLSVSQFRALFSVSANTHTSASTNTYGLTAEVGLYTLNASTISRMSSGTQSWSGTYSTNSTASVQGIRELTVPINASMTPGEYWIGWRISSSSVNASLAYSQYIVSNQLTVYLSPGRLGAASNSSQVLYPMHGLYTVSSGALPASATLNDIHATGTRASAAFFWFDLRNYTVV